ncbi:MULTISPECIES: rhamnose ABC transporter substrate-binding protein [Planococcaceae]|uniref:Rhamnose ABC transporter substrate-binding protein n=1 Tax=Planococcus halotolerans TaxID=2233542 RepID=A0A365L8A0_9BACL|nr:MULTISPECIES: rhamnose ABC transporter substrate-binding protein [Planococcaceae]RAZ81595.1 rhamnose ABC transporter substrate-binding protein [Planococcus halotolerans]RLQ90574.1 rhamnose ABC transporter substrate-binding protein [Planomicrobium sp. Y74]
MKKILSKWAVVGLAVGLLAACGNEDAAPGGEEAAAGGGTDGKPTYAMVFKNTGNPYGEKMMDGFEEAIKEAGGEVILRAPDQPTAEGQIQIVEQLITQQVDSILITGNDIDALQPVLEKAMDAGIKVLSADSAVNPESRMVHVNQADPELIGRTQIQAVSEMIDGEGQIAVLSATSQAANQNLWIEWMKKELEKPEYENIELVKVAYGDDLRDKSTSEAEALLLQYPDLKAIVSPTTVGIAAAGKVLTDKGLAGKVILTGLGLPSEMATYIENGVSPAMFLWNPIDVGYGAGMTAVALVEGDITGALGETFEAGRLGEKEIVEDGEGTQVMLGEPFRFDKDNIGEWKEVY